MDLLIQQGVHKRAPNGRPLTVTGQNLILQQALHLLAIPKGSFPYDRSLGSRLHQLRWQEGPPLQREALIQVGEALSPLKEVEVKKVDATLTAPDEMTLRLSLSIQEQPVLLEVSL